MIDQDIQTYSQKLQQLGIEHEILEHPSLRAPREVLNSLGYNKLADCIPTLMLKADGADMAVVIRGDSKADFKKMKKMLKIKNLRMATPEEFTSLTGLPLGAARVYNPGVKTLLDRKIFEHEYLIGGSGRFDCSLRYKIEDLRKIPESSVEDITEELTTN